MGHRQDNHSSLQTKMVAGLGASIVGSVVTNPLDVIKTRMQAARAPSSTDVACCKRVPVRSSSSWPWAAARMEVLRMSTHASLRRTLRNTSGAAASVAWATPELVLADCACGAAALSAPNLTQSKPEPVSMFRTVRGMLLKEGVRSLWKGLDSSLLMSLPAVLIYYPLYDSTHQHLLEHSSLGAATPAVAGAAARCATAAMVAPIDLIRTRQQAGSGAAGAAGTPGAKSGSTFAMLRASLNSGTQAAVQQAGSGAVNPRALQGLWVGFGATLMRDVPFSMVYWALVEPMRAHLLAASASYDVAGAPGSTLPPQQTVGAVLPPAVPQQQQPWGWAEAEGSGSSCAARATHDAAATTQTSQTLALPHSQPTSTPMQPFDQPTHTPSQVLQANLVAGALAGSIAAAVATPFDVVKTRLQVGPGTGPEGRQAGGAQALPRTTMGVLRHIWRTEGVAGLFTGLVPRALRSAPACAFVIGAYESLKLLQQ